MVGAVRVVDDRPELQVPALATLVGMIKLYRGQAATDNPDLIQFRANNVLA